MPSLATFLPAGLRNRTLLSVSLAIAAGYTGIGMVVPVRVLYVQSRGASLAIIGAMASSYLIANFLFQYPAGALADRFGRKPLMIGGFALQAILTLSYLAVSDPVLFVLLRFVEGIAGAAVLPPARALVTDAVPEDRRGEAYGIFGAFFNAGFLLGPALGGVVGSLGYTPVFFGAVLGRVLAIALILGLPTEPSHGTAVRRHQPRVPRRALFSPALIGAYTLAFGDYVWLGFDMTVGVLWLRHHLGASVLLIGITYAAWSLPSIVIAPYGGRLADRTRRSRVILLFGLAQLPLYLAYGWITTVGAAIALFIVHSVLYSFVQPAADSYLAIASPPAARARAQSVATAAGLISAFLASTLLPALYAVQYRLTFWVMAGVFGVCIVAGGALVRRTEREGAGMPLAVGVEERASPT